MKAILEKMEVAFVGLALATAGVAGSFWMLKSIDSSLANCAAFTPYMPF